MELQYGDCIQFSDRVEIKTVMDALDDWKKTHKDDGTIEQMITLLDKMSMEW